MILFDSIIIGGGPAGASAGEMMARAGLKTLILEKATMPRYKCCAGGLPLKLVELLGFAPDRLEGKEIRGIVFSWKSGSRRFLESRTPLGWVVKREEFDRLLLSRAAAAGAEIRQGEEFLRLRQSESGVTVRSDRGEYRARTVIGADGAAGRVSRQLKLGGYKR